jgi:hypothetical protein
MMSDDDIREARRTGFVFPSAARVDRITVTRVEYCWGSGNDTGDPVRRLVELHDVSGPFLRWDQALGETFVSHIPTEQSQREAKEA